MIDDPRLIDAPDDVPDWDRSDERVQKIVLGKLGSGDPKTRRVAALHTLPTDFATRFPHLTHLYLWNLPELTSLPELPAHLRCLDIRGCAMLERCCELPPSLEVLIVEGCPILTDLSIRSRSANDSDRRGLEELSLQGCSSLPDACLQALVADAPALQILDLSHCTALTTVAEWPPRLVDVRLNDCANVTALLDWPPLLRRLELRGVPLTELQRLPSAIDYINLGGMRHLRKLPEGWDGARTLFLHGSGCLEPPASEHGAAVDENVAERTRRYFADLKLVGAGAVRRCKVLVLGNGGAGKTCLSLNVVGENPLRTRPDYQPESERIGTTHGVQFHRWQVKGNVGPKSLKVAVHVWDFGGQEIYHNTHRLFLASGSVFVVIWDPEPPARADSDPRRGYIDTTRSLGYWLDYIEQAVGPFCAEVIVVCSKRSARDADVLRRMAVEAGEARLERLSVHFVDSLATGRGIEALRAELTQRILRVVDAQGTVVPGFWEIAQDMVESWVTDLEKGETSAIARRQMTFVDFGCALGTEIERRAAPNGDPKFLELRHARESGRFELNEDRIERTLSFLTHSGWVFWGPELFDRRVIVGQRWALDGLYTLLEREVGGKPSPVFRALRQRAGRFTLEDLAGWGWATSVPDPTERELLISFMQRIGLCFTLVNQDESLWGTATFVSLAHLPWRTAIQWRVGDDGTSSDLLIEDHQPTRRRVEHPRLHLGHWDSILRALGARFGTDGVYARDGFIGRTRKGQGIRIDFDLHSSGFGGQITVDVIGPEAESLQEELAGSIERSIAAEVEHRTPDETVADVAGEAAKAVSVFLSYAWELRVGADGKKEAAPPRGYEIPVDCIYNELRAKGVNVQRDRLVTRPGESIVEFMKTIKVADKVVVVHSDKFWRSPFCMFEGTELCRGLIHQPRKLYSVLIMVSHIHAAFDDDGHRSTGPLDDNSAREALIAYWRSLELSQVSTMLGKAAGFDGLKAAVLNLLLNDLPEIAALLGVQLRWEDAVAEQIVADVVKRVLPA